MEDGYKLKSSYNFADLLEYVWEVSPGLAQMMDEVPKINRELTDKKLSIILTTCVVWPTELLERIERLHNYILSRETTPFKVVTAGQTEWTSQWGQYETLERAEAHIKDYSHPVRVEIKILY